MNTNDIPTIYDFPPGYPSFESMLPLAVRILQWGHYIDPHQKGQVWIKVDQLRQRITISQDNWTDQVEFRYFFPIVELVEQWILSLDEIRRHVQKTFIEQAQKSLKFAYNIEADHIPSSFFLAWWIANCIFSESEINDIRFDDGDHEWEYRGQKYVEKYWWHNIHAAINSVVHMITIPNQIEALIAQDNAKNRALSALDFTGVCCSEPHN
jgi:hypothetical protein